MCTCVQSLLCTYLFWCTHICSANPQMLLCFFYVCNVDTLDHNKTKAWKFERKIEQTYFFTNKSIGSKINYTKMRDQGFKNPKVGHCWFRASHRWWLWQKWANRWQFQSFRTSATTLNHVLEFEAEVYPLNEKACIYHDYTTIRDIVWHISKDSLDNKDIDYKYIFWKKYFGKTTFFLQKEK